MATLKDVAKLAHVDVSTVSRALNNKSYVHPDTKARIMAAVEELSYKPNVLARGLRSGKRHTIALVIPKLGLTIFEDLAETIDLAAREKGYAVLICHTSNDPAIEKECLNRLRNGFVDGIIIAPTGKNIRLLKDIQSDGIPVVQLIRKQDSSISSVIGNYEEGAYNSTYFLYEKGCRSIGLINGDLTRMPYAARYRGYERAVSELSLENISVSADNVKTSSFEYGYSCTDQMLDLYPDIDGILTAVDVQGMAALRVLKDRGRKVPEDVKVISLTGYSIGDKLETRLSSCELPADEMGKKSVELLIEEIEAPDEKKPGVQHVEFSASFDERETT